MPELHYAIIEDSLTVCKGIKERMNDFPEWECCCFLQHKSDAIKEIRHYKPQLIFLDWALKGGSAYEVLSAIETIREYNPYIIFNTGFQSENPEIPQQIINHYTIDKYLVKPLWENLRLHLKEYLEEAKLKSKQPRQPAKKIWLTDVLKQRHPVDFANIVCIQQHFDNPYHKVFYFTDCSNIIVKISWTEITDQLEKQNIRFFITNSRSHIVVYDFIQSYQRPFVRLKNFKHRIEVVKNRLSAFEKWLKEMQSD